MRIPKYIIPAFLLFCLCLFLGFSIATHRILWNDERWTLNNSVLGISYPDMLVGRIQEGNNSPLFYVLQKAQCDFFSYHPPADWPWEGQHLYSQLFLRAQPVACVALAIAALFYFFARRLSAGWGLYAAAVGLSSFMLWDHWAEARPYALWFLLSIFQILLLVQVLEPKPAAKPAWRRLALAHVLLCLTATVSVIQVGVASLVVWVFGQRQWKRHIAMTAVPVGLALFYYWIGPKYHFFFADGPIALLCANIPKDRFLLFLMFGVAFSISHWKNKDWLTFVEGKYLLFVALILSAFGLLLVYLQLRVTPGAFQISNRYFMPLTAVGIVGTVLFSIWLARWPKSKFLRVAVLALIGAFLFFRAQRVFPFIKASFYVNGIL